MHRPVVVLPLPDSPTSPNVSPSAIEKLTSSTAWTTVFFASSPCPRVKCLVRCRTSSSGLGTALIEELPVVQEAADRAAAPEIGDAGHERVAVLEPRRAPRREGAAGRHVTERRNRSLDRLQPSAGRSARNRRQQALRIGMFGVAEQLGRRRLLDDPSGVHDGDAVRRLRDDAEIVRDQEERQLELALHVAQEFQDLRLDGDVERRRRLVGDEQRRPARERHRDERALPEPAGELVRILVHASGRLGHAHGAEQIDRTVPRLAPLRAPVDYERFRNLIPDREHRVERRHRFLEHEADLGPSDFAHPALVQCQ